jgi:thiol-disulfide isomerase/thioredoxin
MQAFLIHLILLTLPGFAPQAGAAKQLTGQVVCGVERWATEDRRLVPYGDILDREAAARCLLEGEHPVLAVMDAEGRATIYQLEGGAFKARRQDWLPYVGDTVEVTGAVVTEGGTARLRVDALRVLVHAMADLEPRWEVVPDDPELALKDLSGAPRRLSAYLGRVVVLNFFATYCVPCRRELPSLAAFHDEYSGRGVQVIGVSADGAGDGSKVRRFVKEVGLNFPVWLGATESDMGRFGLGATLPGTVIIGRDGRVAGRVEGTFDPDELRRQVDALLTRSEGRP